MSIKGFSVSGVTDRYDYNYLDNKPEIHSIPTGGTAGQVLAKRSGADYAVEWADQTGGGGDITVDDVLSNTSENPVQNKVITAALATKADQAGIQQVIEDEVDDWLSVQAPSIGTLSYAAKQALLACFRKVAWIDNQGQTYYNALESELFPDTTLESIAAVFTQGSAAIYETDSLDTLRQYLTVAATYSDSTTTTVTDYTLSGTLASGTSTITVSYGGKTDTFTVTVTAWTVKWSYLDGGLPYNSAPNDWVDVNTSIGHTDFVVGEGVHFKTDANGQGVFRVYPKDYQTTSNCVIEVIARIITMPSRNGVILRGGNGTIGMQASFGNNGLSVDNNTSMVSGVSITTGINYTFRIVCNVSGTCYVYLDGQLVSTVQPSNIGSKNNHIMMTSGGGVQMEAYISAIRFYTN